MTTQAQVQGLGEFNRFGFTLERQDDDTVELHHEGDFVARFSQFGATEGSLQEECARHLVMKHGWDGCLLRKEEYHGRQLSKNHSQRDRESGDIHEEGGNQDRGQAYD